jgi:hypothetical protein
LRTLPNTLMVQRLEIPKAISLLHTFKVSPKRYFFAHGNCIEVPNIKIKW